MKKIYEDRKTLEVELLSPLHIGSGKELDFSSFIQKGDTLLVIDYPKIVAENESIRRIVMEAHPQELFSKLEKKLNKIPDIEKYIKDKLHLTKEVARYFSEKTMQESQKKVKILPGHITGRKYIPGSSLKGAIRTGFLLSLLRENYTQKYLQIQASRNFKPRKQQEMAHRFKKTRDYIESKLLSAKRKGKGKSQLAEIKVAKDFKDSETRRLNLKSLSEYRDSSMFAIERDPFHYLQITDGKPIEEVKTRVYYQKKRLNLPKNKFVNLYNFLECFPPGSKFTFTVKLTISHFNKTEWDKFGIKSVEDLLAKSTQLIPQIAEYQANLLGKNFKSYAEKIKEILREKEDDEFLLRLGGGIGRYYVGISSLFFPHPHTIAVLENDNHKFLGWAKAKILN